MAEDEQKKQGEGAPPPSETVLDSVQQERDPDEAVFAEDAIHTYAESALDSFRQTTEMSLDAVTAWIEGQASTETLDNSGVTARLGSSYLELMLSAFGGKDTPIGAKFFEQVDGVVDQAVRF